ncbi:ribosome biogenesis protein BRX1 homolog isoform X1 [Amphibalanus amphitrite]|uniref:ribosome biogenesis protein BRX1 homolog isoform X1 n=2 Tax=Amphibalanus amphitrite TaxID=1232801 RepID=UPI001C925879|nr:ribosome biogenesis protein BRX1 homolog isoform X1 [Amphibalanus amphitrite]
MHFIEYKMGKVTHKKLKKAKKLPKSELKMQKTTSKEVVKNSIVESSTPEDQPKKDKWINKQRVLVFSSRGISHRYRHLMTDIKAMLPHAKAESKMDKKDEKRVINEICEMKNCNKCLFFEPRRDSLYLWMSNVPDGPTGYFLVESVHTMQELKMTGNSLKGSRPLLSFDTNFTLPHLQLFKELLTQVFGTPKLHPKSQPFVDHVMTFSWLDQRIWFRNYQIVQETGALAEIGPRFVLNPVKVFAGSFQGEKLWENPHFVSPTSRRRLLKMSLAHKYIHRKDQQQSYLARKPGKDETVKVDVTDDVLLTSHGDDSGAEEAEAPPRPALVNRRRHGKKRKR